MYVLGDHGGDSLAGAAPCGKGIEEDDGLAGNGLLELLLAVKGSRVSSERGKVRGRWARGARGERT